MLADTFHTNQSFIDGLESVTDYLYIENETKCRPIPFVPLVPLEPLPETDGSGIPVWYYIVGASILGFCCIAAICWIMQCQDRCQRSPDSPQHITLKGPSPDHTLIMAPGVNGVPGFGRPQSVVVGDTATDDDPYRIGKSRRSLGNEAHRDYRHLPSDDMDYTPGKTVQFHDTVGQAASSSDSDISPTFVLDDMFNVEMQEMVRNELFQEISKEDYHHKVKLMDVIHHGQFGKIWKAQWKQENDINYSNRSRLYVVKMFENDDMDCYGQASHVSIEPVDKEVIRNWFTEHTLTATLPQHPNVMRIDAFCKNPLCVVMEYMNGGSVRDLVYGMTKKVNPSPSEKLVILIKACCGLKHLTRNGLHHRDIVAKNILIGHYEDEIDEKTLVKITGFGIARKTMDSLEDTKDNGGPIKWMAPESIQKKEYNEKTDVYMFGITMWEIMYGQEPYENVEAVNVAMNVCMKDERPDFLWDLPPGLRELIEKCWDKDPEQRPTFEELGKELERVQADYRAANLVRRKSDLALEKAMSFRELEEGMSHEAFDDDAEDEEEYNKF